ncbi:alpha/beta hydrolase [Streptomyces sp. NPDC047985]|uniref:alpha/beta fold hydrolase n=1 Tax=Streptomyces sp. NPDC047985 TaxID=3155384 RepID=UPI00341723EF
MSISGNAVAGPFGFVTKPTYLPGHLTTDAGRGTGATGLLMVLLWGLAAICPVLGLVDLALTASPSGRAGRSPSDATATGSMLSTVRASRGGGWRSRPRGGVSGACSHPSAGGVGAFGRVWSEAVSELTMLWHACLSILYGDAMPTEPAPGQPVRAYLATPDGRRLSYLDFGPAGGRPLLGLHGHLGEGADFAELARALRPDGWRVVALDQRGHGDSDRAKRYDRDGYLDDLSLLFTHLGLDHQLPLPVVGHSLGAINGYYLAATRPDAVSALINIDGPVHLPVVDPAPLSVLLALPYSAPTREELLAACGSLTPLLENGLRPHHDGWRLGCHPADMVDSDTRVLGDHWHQWLGSHCPALLLHGTASTVLPTAQARAMASRRHGTTLVELHADHWVHLRRPKESAVAIRRFLDSMRCPRPRRFVAANIHAQQERGMPPTSSASHWSRADAVPMPCSAARTGP